MNRNEMMFCLMVFCKFFKGKNYKDVVKDCYIQDGNAIIDVNKLNIGQAMVSLNDYAIGFISMPDIFFYRESLKSLKFSSVKEFIKYFKIPLKDVVWLWTSL